MATCKSSSQTGLDSWQSRKSLSECLRYSLENKKFTNVTFKVGREQKIVHAHRQILSIRSGVFEAMFYGPLAEQDEIVIPEVEHNVFEQFLRYRYTDDVAMDGASVMGLLYISKKYDVKTLEQKCLTYLSSSMTTDNCVILEQAHVFDEQELKEEALTFILENGDATLKSSGVTDLCHDSLVKIIEAEELEADEQSVFEAVVAWSESACRKQNKDVTHENRGQVIGKAITHVRFPLLDQKYFERNVVPTNLLTNTEKFNIVTHCVCPDENVSLFNSKKRIGIICKEKIIIQRFTGLIGYYGCPCPSDTDHGIMFSVNQDASLQGFQLYGPCDRKTANYDVRAFITDSTTDDVIEGSSVTKSVSVASGMTPYDVEFLRPIKLRKGKKYSLTDLTHTVGGRKVLEYRTGRLCARS